jgi:hypothetical protein
MTITHRGRTFIVQTEAEIVLLCLLLDQLDSFTTRRAA